MKTSDKRPFRGPLVALLILCPLLASKASGAANVAIDSVWLSDLTPCAGSTCTLNITLQDLVDSPSFTPYIYAAEEPSAYYSCGNGGFTTACCGTPLFYWDVYGTTNPSAPGQIMGPYAWPNDGGWAAPVTLSYTGQTYTASFQVTIGGTDDANTAYEFYVGASSVSQSATNADAYTCLQFTSCPNVGSMVPTFTPTDSAGTATMTPTTGYSFTATPTSSNTPDLSPTTTDTPSPSPTATTDATSPLPTATRTASPSPTTTDTPHALSPTETSLPFGLTLTTTRVVNDTAPWLSILPNFIFKTGAMTVRLQSNGGGIASLRVLDQNGRTVRTLMRQYLAPQENFQTVWNADDDNGSPISSGVFYVAFTDGNGKRLVQKVLVVR